MKPSFSSIALFTLLLGSSAAALPNRTHTTALTANQIDWNYEQKLSQLPLKGDIGFVPWRDDYWATATGEIARRWDGTIAAKPSAVQVRAMSEQELRNLSPAEKYDIARNDFSYSLTSKVLDKLARTSEKYDGSYRNAPGWEGLCHGWAPAALNFKVEPQPIEYTGQFDRKLPFGSSDTKALLTWFQGEWGTSAATYDKHDVRHSIGKTCALPLTDPNYPSHPDCNDVGPDVFHVVLANRIGKQKKGIVSDTEFNEQVWNFPIYRYQSKKLATNQAPAGKYLGEAIKVVTIKTTIAVAIEIHPSWEATGTDNENFATKTISYQYDLALDARGHIVDGSWGENSPKPDTLWLYEKFNFTALNGSQDEILSTELGKIYNAATAQ